MNVSAENNELVHIIFDHERSTRHFEISGDLGSKWEDLMEDFSIPHYMKITFSSYNTHICQTKISNCFMNRRLPQNTISVAASLFNVSPYVPTIKYCKIDIIEDQPEVLDSITFLLQGTLYDKLSILEQKSEILQFLLKKFNITNRKTVVENYELISKLWCKVINTAPSYLGVIDLHHTQISIVRDDTDILGKVNDFGDSKEVKSTLLLECLKHPISKELVNNSIDYKECLDNLNEDDDLYAFTGINVFEKLGIADGTMVNIYNGAFSTILKIFVLREPNKLTTSSIFVHPRIFASFGKSLDVNINVVGVNISNIPIAKSVSLARVGSFHQTQRRFEEIIITNLKAYLTKRNRILKVKELIPIAFDSILTELMTSDYDFVDNIHCNDKLVWFSIENVELENDRNHQEFLQTDREFIIDTAKTKLVTENIVSIDPSILNNNCYNYYFGIEPVIQYDYSKFDYAKKMKDIMLASRNCARNNVQVNTKILLSSLTANTGKSTLVKWLALDLGFELFSLDCVTLLNSSSLGSLSAVSKTIGFITAKIESFLTYSLPAIVYLLHIEVLLQDSDPNQGPATASASKSMDIELSKLIDHFYKMFPTTIFVFSTNSSDSLPNNFVSGINFEIELPVPTEDHRVNIFKHYLSLENLNSKSLINNIFNLSDDVDINILALKSAGLAPLDIKYVIENSKYKALERTKGVHNRIVINKDDLELAINDVRGEFAASIGAPKIPTVTWDDIGGIDIVKGEIMDTIDMPMKHPELFSSGMKKRSGILFYGPPGTGKTLMAKAIATNFALNFFSVKGPELLNMYIGESEANVRRVFQKARDAKPCVIFFDELDSVAPKRGNQGDSGGVMDRIVSQLLAELDGMGSNGDGIFVIGATNRPDLLDEALLRPGRFDKLLYLGIPDTNEKQLNILQALSRKFKLSSDCDLSIIAERSPFNYTGADFYALCSDAMLNAMTRIAGEVDQKVKAYNESTSQEVSIRFWFDNIATDDDTKVIVKLDDYIKAQNELSPSVSVEELQHYLRVKHQFEG